MAHGTAERWLALEIRSWKFSFVVVETNRILEWGTCRFPAGTTSKGERRLAFLLKTYNPSLVVTRSTRRANHGSARKSARLLRIIRKVVERRSIQFAVIPRHEIRSLLAEQGCRNKHEIAGMISNRFRELQPRVPPSRKAWDSEWDTTSIFDAMTTAIAFEAFQVKT